jgi:hypothetical protein
MPETIKHNEVISNEVVPNQNRASTIQSSILSKPLVKRAGISEPFLLSCNYVLDTNTPDTSSLIEQVVCLDITGPVGFGRCQVDAKTPSSVD